jgi:AcrR family transcriptional regulator
MRAERKESRIRKRQIAEAALGLIARKGMKGLSLAAVAEKVGVVPSALYRHYQGKEAILEATLGLIRHLILENIQTVQGRSSSPLEQLKLLMERHLQMIQEFQAIPRIVFSDEMDDSGSPGRAGIYRIIRGLLREVARIIAKGQEQGEIKADLDSDTLSVIFLGLVQPPAILWYLSRGRFDIQGHMAKAWPMFEQLVERPSPKK